MCGSAALTSWRTALRNTWRTALGSRAEPLPVLLPLITSVPVVVGGVVGGVRVRGTADSVIDAGSVEEFSLDISPETLDV